ncbi:ATP-dependent zinc metalloprotease FtsH [Candidatus Falkowbacteria bacterium]|nr:ATP-dependent zinc metalloprotease FtsH [Candidatus Falkowbacteria bacterium]
MQKNLFKNILIFAAALLVISSLFSLYDVQNEKAKTIGVPVLVQQINNAEIAKIEITDSSLDVILKNDEKETIAKEAGDTFSELVKNYQIDPAKLAGVEVVVKEQSGFKFWVNVLVPIVLPLLLIIGFIWFMTRQVQGANMQAMNFGRSRARETKKGQVGNEIVTFKDVAGVKEAKEELQEIVEFLKHPKKFLKLGAKIPRGVLLLGAPGTGKTLLARAVAGEAGVQFFSISGSEFVEMFVGVGASRVRDLFARAKKHTPCILFIDEIDAVGRQRGAGLGGSHDEREQTLNQILVEMDGFDPTTNLIVLAATNRPDVLDPALLRPGRFDRRVFLDLPDINDREAILKVHARKKPLASDANLRHVAERTPGFSGADLANVLNEAAILTARRDKNKINETEILESIEKVLLGPERQSFLLSQDEKKVTAYHEAGHALVAHLMPHADPVHKISIVSRGRAAGYTLNLPEEDRRLHRKSEFLDDLAVLLAGYVTEKEIFSEVTTGAGDDLRKATELSRDLITRYGMSDKLSPRIYGGAEEMIFLGRDIREQRNYSERVAEQIDAEIDRLVTDAAARAKEVVTENKERLENIVKVLLEKETIEKDEFVQVVGVPKAVR